MTYIGVDISKEKFDVSYDNQFKQYTNNASGIAKFIETLSSENKVIFESTGVYSILFHKILCENKINTCRINPYKSRQFARGAGFLAKTDKVDAKMLKKFGELMDPTPIPYNFSNETLSELVYTKESLGKNVQALKNRLERSFNSKVASDAIHASIEALENQVKIINEELQKMMKTEQDLKEKIALLISIPGVGVTTAIALLCYAPELGNIDKKALTALAGLAPMTCQSGTMRGFESIRGGRPLLRKAFFFPALVAIRHNLPLKDLYERLVAKGKPKKKAVVAVMRKLLIYANAVLEKREKFDVNLNIKRGEDD